MTLRLIWFVLAGFLLGFTASTLWEWLHYRRHRLILEAMRFDEMEAQIAEEKAVNTQLRMMLNGTESTVGAASVDAFDAAAQSKASPVSYSSPGVFLDSEKSELDNGFGGVLPAAASVSHASDTDLLVAAAAAAREPAGDRESEKAVVGRLAAELQREPAPGQTSQSDAPEVPYIPRSDDYPDDLSRIRGVGNVYTYRLYNADIYTWRQVAETDADKLRTITGAFAAAKVDDWPEFARLLADENDRQEATYSGPTPDDLAQIPLLTPADQETLYHAGICTYGQLACLTLDEMSDLFPTDEAKDFDLGRWIQAAVELANSRHEA